MEANGRFAYSSLLLWRSDGGLLRSLYLSLMILLSTIISSLRVYRVSNPAAALLVAFNGDRHNVPARNH